MISASMILITNGISICETILNHHGKTIMKNKSMLAALAVLLMTSDVRAATCPETLSRVIGPDFTCVSLTDRLLVTFRRKIGALGRVVKGAQQRKTRRERPAGVLQSLMVRAGGFTGQPAFPLRGRC